MTDTLAKMHLEVTRDRAMRWGSADGGIRKPLEYSTQILYPEGVFFVI